MGLYRAANLEDIARALDGSAADAAVALSKANTYHMQQFYNGRITAFKEAARLLRDTELAEPVK